MKKIAICCLLGLLVVSSTTLAQSPSSLSDLYKFSLIPERISKNTSFAFSKATQVIPEKEKEKKKDWPFTGLIGAHLTLSALDLHLTFRGIDNGYEEVNPIMAKIIHNRPLAIAVKIVGAYLTSYLLYKLKKKSKLAAYITLGCIVLFEGYLVYRNYKIGGLM